jgi:hypothetical protein
MCFPLALNGTLQVSLMNEFRRDGKPLFHRGTIFLRELRWISEGRRLAGPAARLSCAKGACSQKRGAARPS